MWSSLYIWISFKIRGNLFLPCCDYIPSMCIKADDQIWAVTGRWDLLIHLNVPLPVSNPLYDRVSGWTMGNLKFL